MSLSPAEIRQVVGELAALQGAVVQKAFVPRERVLFLELRVPGASHLLEINVEPGRARLHIASGRPPSPQEALAFQQQARAHLVGRTLTASLQPAPRRVELRFADGEGERLLEVEVSGRNGNLVLASASGTVIAVAGSPLPAGRGLSAGRAYEPPVESEAPRPASRYPAGEPFAVSAAIERDYSQREAESVARTRREQIEAPLRRRRDRLRRTLQKVEGEAHRTEKAEEHRVAGELLKTSLSQVRRGAGEVRLTDYASGEPREVVVALKAELSPADNLAWHFRQYRRLSQGSQRAAARLEELRAEVASIEAELAAVAARSPEELEAMAPAPASPSRPKASERGERLPYKEFTGTGGRAIRVGKGALENDSLSFKHARPNDLWLHARGLPGAHVVVPLQRGEAPPSELLLDACALAVHFSSAKGQDRVEVSYLPAKYLRKVKGSAGAVTYSQEKTLRYVHEPARIARLLATREE